VRLIEKEEAAKRLARVILSDIELYNAQKVRSRADLKPELDEGYALFRSRVAPELVPIFSKVVADRLGGDRKAAPAPKAAPPPVAAVTPPPPPPGSPRHSPAAPPIASRPEHLPPPARPEQLPPREAARRLARMMVAGIETGDRDDAGIGLAREIEEARTLFRSCVLPELAPLFEDALAERGLRDEEAQAAPATPKPPVAPPLAGDVTEPLAGDATDRVMVSQAFAEQPTEAAFVEELDLPTIAKGPPAGAPPPVTEPELSSEAPWTLSNGRLAAAAMGIAALSAGIVYYLLTGP
jgi:hypothetical protein